MQCVRVSPCDASLLVVVASASARRRSFVIPPTCADMFLIVMLWCLVRVQYGEGAVGWLVSTVVLFALSRSRLGVVRDTKRTRVCSFFKRSEPAKTE